MILNILPVIFLLVLSGLVLKTCVRIMLEALEASEKEEP